MANDKKLDEVFQGVGADAFPGKRPLREITTPPPKTQGAAFDDWDRKPLHRMYKGALTEFFTIGHLSAALGREQVTIRSWEAKGWLPKSKYRAPAPKGEQVPGKAVAGRRLYTREQIEVVITAARKYGVMANKGQGADWKKFRVAVLDGWRTIN